MVIRDKVRGCKFVWVPLTGEVKDVRIYVEASAGRDCGWGYLIFSFVQAFFFPWVTDLDRDLEPSLSAPVSDRDRSRFHLPIGGCRGATFMTVLPKTTQSKVFYRRQGFKSVTCESKWVYAPPVVKALMSTPPANELVAASHCTNDMHED